MKKFNLFAIGVVAMLMAAVNVSAATLTVTDATNSDTLGSASTTCTDSRPDTKKGVLCTTATFTTLEAGEEGEASEGRPEGYAWIGAQFTMTGASAGFEWYIDGEKVDGLTTHEFFGFNLESIENALEAGKNSVSKTYVVTWTDENADGSVTSHKENVILEVEIKTLTLKEHGKTTPVWNANTSFTDYTADRPLVTVNVISDSLTVLNRLGTNTTISFRIDKNDKLTEAYVTEKVNKYLVDNDLVAKGYYTAEDYKTAYTFGKVISVSGDELYMLVTDGTTKPIEDDKPAEDTPGTGTENQGGNQGSENQGSENQGNNGETTNKPVGNPDTLDNVTSVAAMGGISLAIAAAGIATLKKREN